MRRARTMKGAASMRKFLIVLVAATFAFLGLPAAAEAASVDVTAPVLESVTVDPGTVDVGASEARVTVTAHITDDMSGVVAPYFVLGSTSASQQTGYVLASLVSGTANNGIYRAVITVPKGAATGTWQLRKFATFG